MLQLNVEHTLKENAVDTHCEINRGVNLFAGSPFNQPIEMIDLRRKACRNS